MSKIGGLYIIDNVQPQTASYMSVAARNGMVTQPGTALAFLALMPSADIQKAIDISLKRSEIKLSFLQTDSRVGFVVLQSDTVDEIRDVIDAISHDMQLGSPPDGVITVESQFMSRVDPRQAYLVNRPKMGSLCVPGDSLYVLECDPSGFALAAVNEAEKAANIRIVDFKFTGSMGRMIISGDDSNVRAARDAALGLVEVAA